MCREPDDHGLTWADLYSAASICALQQQFPIASLSFSASASNARCQRQCPLRGPCFLRRPFLTYFHIAICLLCRKAAPSAKLHVREEAWRKFKFCGQQQSTKIQSYHSVTQFAPVDFVSTSGVCQFSRRVYYLNLSSCARIVPVLSVWGQPVTHLARRLHRLVRRHMFCAFSYPQSLI